MIWAASRSFLGSIPAPEGQEFNFFVRRELNPGPLAVWTTPHKQCGEPLLTQIRSLFALKRPGECSCDSRVFGFACQILVRVLTIEW